MRIIGSRLGNIATVLTGLLLAGCTTAGSISAPPQKSVGSSASASASTGLPPLKSPQSSADCGRVDESVDYGDYVIAGMHGEGTLPGFKGSSEDVAVNATSLVADVVSFGPAFFGATSNQAAVAPGRHVYTPVNLNVSVAIRGVASTAPITVVEEGGTIGCFTFTVYGLPSVNVGSRYLLFLSPAYDIGSGLPLGRLEIRFAWPVDAEGMVQTPNGPKSVADVIAAIDRVASGPAAATPTPGGSPLPSPSATS